jgi:hypothetical protein
MPIERVGDYRAVMPLNRGRRERDDKKQRPRRRETPPSPQEHQIDERA